MWATAACVWGGGPCKNLQILCAVDIAEDILHNDPGSLTLGPIDINSKVSAHVSSESSCT